MARVDDNELSIHLRQEAVGLGLCDEWTGGWRDDSSRDELLDKFVKGIDFCITNRWPSVEQMKEFLPEANMHGVYVDQKDVLVRNPSVAVFNGDCTGLVFVDDGVSTVWVRHGSSVKVRVRRGGSVFLRLLDDCHVEVDCGFFSKCKVFVYSDGVTLTGCDDSIDVIRKVGFYER